MDKSKEQQLNKSILNECELNDKPTNKSDNDEPINILDNDESINILDNDKPINKSDKDNESINLLDKDESINLSDQNESINILNKEDKSINIDKKDQLINTTNYETKFSGQNYMNQPIKIPLLKQNTKLLSYSAPNFKSPNYQLTSEYGTEKFIEENLKKFNKYHNQEIQLDQDNLNKITNEPINGKEMDKNLINFFNNFIIHNDKSNDNLINYNNLINNLDNNLLNNLINNLNNDQLINDQLINDQLIDNQSDNQNAENKINLSDEYIKVNLIESNIEFSNESREENNLINSINCNLDNHDNVPFSKDESTDEIDEINLPTNFSVASLTNDFPISDIYQIAREIKRTYLLKIIILGDSNTGKTSFVKRFTCNSTPRHYMPTFGLEFSMKIIETDEQKEIRLQIYDISGEKNQDSLTKLYFRDASGALIFFDCSRESTFKNVTKWKEHLDANVRLLDNSKLPTVLIANKCDLKKSGPAKDPAMIEKFCHQFEFHNYFFTSAKTNQNINKSVESLIRLIFESRMEFHYNQEMNIKLEDSNDNRKSGFRCFC